MSETLKFFVCRGRTVVSGERSYGPGEIVAMSASDAAFAIERGFISTEPPVLTAPSSIPNPSGIGVQGFAMNAQGSY